tara:strand:- start:345 stop:527 length:183 start_codon:yes stop_codon:yes gene_type:complete
MEELNITSAKYVRGYSGELVTVMIVVDGETLGVPMDSDNRHYVEILRQVAAGDLTIADAD